MPAKIARSSPQPSFGLPELLVATHISRPGFQRKQLHECTPFDNSLSQSSCSVMCLSCQPLRAWHFLDDDGQTRTISLVQA